MSRLANSMKNAKVSMCFYILTMLLGFISRRVFISNLGPEVLGMNTLIANILNFLNLAELGIGAAIAFSLYKPIYEGDHRSINEIVNVQGFFYKRIGIFITLCAIAITPFLPVFFRQTNVNLYFVYGTFLVLLFSSLLGYFVNYKQNLLEADQKQYIIVYSTYGIRLIKSSIQILVLINASNAYYWWLIIEVIFAIIVSLTLSYNVNRYFPYITNIDVDRDVLTKYREIQRKIRQLFFHKLAGFAVYQSNPIIIFYFTSLVVVASYGNYMLILSGILLLIDSVFNGINASIGNLLQDRDEGRIKEVLWELLSIRMWIAAILCFVYYEMSGPFITLWVGKQFLLSNLSILSLLLYQYFQMTRIAENFLYAYGFFEDVWAGVAEAILHIGLASVGGAVAGLEGIILGSLVSVFLIGVIWKPIFLFLKAFKSNAYNYFLNFLSISFFLICSAVLSHYLMSKISFDNMNPWLNLFCISALTTCLYGFVSACFLFFGNSAFKSLCLRSFMKFKCFQKFDSI